MDSDSRPSNEHWMEAGMKCPDGKTISVANYAKKLMKRSLITGVPNIAESKSNCKRFFKFMVFVFCTCGFFYQATSFIQYILTFPSVVNIEVYIPDIYIYPAFTFCNNNGVKRTRFCAKYPERCTVPESVEEFCSAYSSFCASLKNKTHFLVVKEEFYDFEKNVTEEELLELGHDYESMDIEGTYVDSENSDYNHHSVNDTSGPFIMRRPDRVLLICYSKFLRVDNDLEPLKFRRLLRGKIDLLGIEFDTEPDEVFIPDRPYGLLFHVHTPFTLEDPLQSGIFIQPKHFYVIHFELEEENLLPHPFSSDCTNYIELWLKNNRTGPRSQESCLEKCEMDYCLQDCNCTFPEVFYPTSSPTCTSDYIYCHDNESSEIRTRLDKELEECNSKCKDDCQRFKFRYHYQFRLQERNLEFQPFVEMTAASRTYVNLVCSNQEIIKYSHRPQYQNLDILSSLGGFIGAWLGVSLVAVVDLLESLMKIAIFASRRKRISHS